jgi:DNA-binding transcriptional LysR family regulator
MEKSLGFRIFNRSTIPLSLTPQGRIYMDYLEETIVSESNMRQRILAIGDLQHGSLSIGGQAYAALHLLPEICGSFYKKHPEVYVTVDIGHTGSLENLLEKLKKGSLELVLSYDYDPNIFDGIPLHHERLIFVIHKDTEGASALAKYAVTREEILRRSYPPEKELEDLSALQNIKFVTYRETSTMSQRMSKMLGEYNLVPHVIINLRQFEILYNFMRAGVGAALVSDFLIQNSPKDADDLLYIVPKSPHSHRTLYILKKKNTPLSPIAEEFVAQALSICSKE